MRRLRSPRPQRRNIRRISRAETRFARLALCLSLALALPPVAAAEPVDDRDAAEGRSWVLAHILSSTNTENIIAHAPPRLFKFRLVPGKGGRVIEVPTAPPLQCSGENEVFAERYDKIADTFPIIRVRYDAARDRFETTGAKALEEARRRTEADVIALVDHCDYIEGDEKAEEIEGIRARVRQPVDLNDDRWYTFLRPVFLGIKATDGFKTWRTRRRDLPCSSVVGERLAKLYPITAKGACTLGVSGPRDPDEPDTIGHVSVVHGKVGPGRTEFGVTFLRRPPP